MQNFIFFASKFKPLCLYIIYFEMWWGRYCTCMTEQSGHGRPSPLERLFGGPRITTGHIESAHVGAACVLGGPRIPFWWEPLSHGFRRPTVTCQLGQLDRYHSGRFSFPHNGFIPTITTLCFPPLPAPPNAASSSLVTTAPRSPPTPSLLPLAVATIRDGLLPWLFRGGQGAPPPPQAVAGTVPQRPRPGNRLDPLCSVSPVARSSSRVCFVLLLPLFDRVLGLDGSDRLIESVCDVGSGRSAGFTEES